MDRRTVAPVLLGALALVALAVVAATLPSATEMGSGSGAGIGGQGAAPDIESPAVGELPAPGRLHPVWQLVFLAVLLALVVAAAVWYRRYASVAVPALLALLAVAVLLLWLTTFFESGGSSLPRGNGSPLRPPPAAGGEGAPTLPSLPALVVVGLVLLAALGVLFRAGALQSAVGRTPPETEPSEDAAALARAAGAAADRLEETAELDNEVYRAWREMTRLLDVGRPDSTTAGEFAEAAVAAGMTREDVDELTGLFEDVRYGPAAPTAATERRAVAVLRRIEATYGSDAEDAP